MIEDRPAHHILDTGIAVMMNKQDYRWCTDCTIYLLVNMIEDKRVYITGQTTNLSGALMNKVKRYLLVNEGKTECLSY